MSSILSATGPDNLPMLLGESDPLYLSIYLPICLCFSSFYLSILVIILTNLIINQWTVSAIPTYIDNCTRHLPIFIADTRKNIYTNTIFLYGNFQAARRLQASPGHSKLCVQREGLSQGKAYHFHNLALQVSQQHLCCILFLRRESLRSVHILGKGNQTASLDGRNIKDFVDMF